MVLTKQQKEKIEANKLIAIARRERKRKKKIVIEKNINFYDYDPKFILDLYTLIEEVQSDIDDLRFAHAKDHNYLHSDVAQKLSNITQQFFFLQLKYEKRRSVEINFHIDRIKNFFKTEILPSYSNFLQTAEKPFMQLEKTYSYMSYEDKNYLFWKLRKF